MPSAYKAPTPGAGDPSLGLTPKTGNPTKEKWPVSETIDWGPLRTLARRVLIGGERLALTTEVKALLKYTASEVGIGEQRSRERTRHGEGGAGPLA